MPAYEHKSQPLGGSLADPGSWQSILNAIPAGAYTCDAAGLLTYFNRLAEAVWGRTPKLRDPADRYCGSFKMYSSNGAPMPHEECWMALALREGKQYNGREVLIERPDGSRILGMVHANPVRDGQGRVIGAVNLVIDISAQKELEADPPKIRSVVAKHQNATLAMIEIAVAAVAGITWARSDFS